MSDSNNFNSFNSIVDIVEQDFTEEDLLRSGLKPSVYINFWSVLEVWITNRIDIYIQDFEYIYSSTIRQIGSTYIVDDMNESLGIVCTNTNTKFNLLSATLGNCNTPLAIATRKAKEARLARLNREWKEQLRKNMKKLIRLISL